jgi:hypothetical protein
MTSMLDVSHDMWDDITPFNIPTNVFAVAGYIDGAYNWNLPQYSPGFRRFPDSLIVAISAVGTNAGNCCDVEPGDLTGTQAVSWVKQRRLAGIDPIVYCSLSAWSSVQSAFNAAGVKQPHYWIAQYNGVRELPVLNGITAVAKQYQSYTDHDISCISDTLVQILGENVTDPVLTDPSYQSLIWAVEAILNNRPTILHGPNAGQPNALYQELQAIASAVSATDADITSAHNDLLTAIKAQPTGGQVDVNALATALTPLLPAQTTPQQLAHEMGAALTAAP